ncbi:MAG: hypothetical protein K8V75_02445 [Methanobrevibacter woesei]|nr:hypothetical protein [Methanobrevibacter woesei]
MSKYKSDYERLETVKKFKCSNKSISQFSRDEKIPYTTLRDWIRAFDNIDGEFVKLKKEMSKPGVVLTNDDATLKLLKNEEIYHKHSSFTRFDHSVVVIEFAKIKITTSLQQALEIMSQYYDRFKQG